MDVSQTELFAGLSEGECRRLRGLAVERMVAAGDVIVEAGRQANAFYLLTDGTADVLAGGEVIASRGPGEWFGEAALLGHESRHATVIARTALTLLAWPGDRLREVLARNPEVLQRVLDTVRRRTHEPREDA